MMDKNNISHELTDKYTIIFNMNGNLIINRYNYYIDLFYLAYDNRKYYNLLNLLKNDKFLNYYYQFDNLVYKEKDIEYFHRQTDKIAIHNGLSEIKFTLFIHPCLLLTFINILKIPIKENYIKYLLMYNSKEVNNKVDNKDIDSNKVDTKNINSFAANNKLNNKYTDSIHKRYPIKIEHIRITKHEQNNISKIVNKILMVIILLIIVIIYIVF